MSIEYSIASEAEGDLSEAYDWYEKRRVGLGDEFLDCVEECVERILRMPDTYAKVRLDYRRAIVKRFPYVVFYRVEGNYITIYGVFHSARDPNKWKMRLR